MTLFSSSIDTPHSLGLTKFDKPGLSQERIEMGLTGLPIPATFKLGN
jgi:hypothetical protein